jgi:hypothetical protein
MGPADEVGSAEYGRGGDGPVTSSALPSRDSDSLTRDEGVEMLESTRSGHEAG